MVRAVIQSEIFSATRSTPQNDYTFGKYSTFLFGEEGGKIMFQELKFYPWSLPWKCTEVLWRFQIPGESSCGGKNVSY